MEQKREIFVIVEALIQETKERNNISYLEAERLLSQSLLEYKVEDFILRNVAEKLNRI